MKHEWRKHEKELYIPKTKPELIQVPAIKYITISGVGDPNKEEFKEKTGVLYSLAYGAKMLPKKGVNIPNYNDYVVYPLEGDWTFVDGWDDSKPMDKGKLSYTIMIRQPNFITKEIWEIVYDQVSKNKPHKYLKEAKFVKIDSHKAVQMLHLGVYDDEKKTFDIMTNFIEENSLKRTEHGHHEIYLSDPRKAEPKNMKTVLRYKVGS